MAKEPLLPIKHRQEFIFAASTVIFSLAFFWFSYLLFFLWIVLVGSLCAIGFFKLEVKLDDTVNNFINACGGNTEVGGSPHTLTKDDGADWCDSCNNNSCSNKHSELLKPETFQPWTGVTVPLKVDAALEEILNLILDRFIYVWYKNLSEDDSVVDELRNGFRFLISQIYNRAKKIDLAQFVTKEVIPVILTHLVEHVHSHRRVGLDNADKIKLRKSLVHRSLHTREDELLYMKALCVSLYPHILPRDAQDLSLLRVILEQILGGLVLLPVADKIADPDIMNYLIILFLDTEPPPSNPDPPSDQVEILSHFSVPNESNSQLLFSHDLGKVLADEQLRHSFTTYMASNGAIRYFNFFLALDQFKRKLLSYENDIDWLCEESRRMYKLFVEDGADDFVDISTDLQSEFKKMVDHPPRSVTDVLKQGEFISRAYDYLYSLIDKYYLPLYRHSFNYYSFIYGPKDARNELHSQFGRTDLRFSKRLSHRLKSINKSDRQLKDLDECSPASTPDTISLKDEDSIDDSAAEKLIDISQWHIDIPSISIQPDLNTNKKQLYLFQIKVYKPPAHIDEVDKDATSQSSYSVYRSYNDFYLLEQKLRQFHGDKVTKQLPPKKIFTTKDHEYLDGVKPIFEEFLKDVIKVENLKNSELVFKFLSTGDFSQKGTAEIRLDRVLKSVPGRLTKERGQNLNHFIKSFQNSTIAKPPGPDQRKLEEATDKPPITPLIIKHMKNPLFERTHIRQPSNGACVDATNHLVASQSGSCGYSQQDFPNSVLDCFCRIVEEVYEVPKNVHWLFTTAKLVLGPCVDPLVKYFVQTKIAGVLQEHRIETLIHLLRDAVFTNDNSPRTASQISERRQQALADLKATFPDQLASFIGKESCDLSTEELFNVLQHPKLNKQLVYALLDIIMCQLFPEVKIDDDV